MKHILLIFILVNMMVFAKADTNRSFSWVDDQNYWPAIYIDKDGKPAGIFNDIMTELFKRLKIPLKKSVYPWKWAQKMVKNGDADGMITVYTKERRTFTVATDPIWNIGETIFFRRDNPKACKILKINSFDELRDFTLVDIQGSGWTKEQYKSHKIKNIIWVANSESALNMIAKGRADIFIMFNLNAYKILSKMRAQKNVLSKDYQNIVAITPTFAKLPFRLLIRKDSPFTKKIKDINKILKDMKKDGTYQNIKEKYSGVIPSL